MTINKEVSNLAEHMGEAMKTLDATVSLAQAAADSALTIADNLQKVLASSYGMVGDGSTNNDAAVSSIPEGSLVDLEGGVYSVSSVPEEFRAFNGGWYSGGVTVPAPLDARRHPLSGNYDLTREYSGLTVHTGPIMYDESERILYRVYTLSPTHYPNYGSMIYLEHSLDMGASWTGTRTVYSSADDRIVSGMVGRVMNGKLGVVLCEQDDPTTPTVRDIVLITAPLSSAKDGPWTSATISGSFTVEHFLYGEMYDYPTAVGGDDSDGFILYSYTNGNAYALHTVDNGANWTQSTVYTSLTLPGCMGGEITVCRLGSENKWVGYMRPVGTSALNEYPNLVAFTTTDMLNLTLADSGITNIGTDTVSDSGAVGHPPYVLYEGGRVNLFIPYRQRWVDSLDKQNEQQLTVFSGNAAEVFNNTGVINNPVKSLVTYLPERATGMMYTTLTPFGYVGWLRAFETSYLTAGIGSVAASAVVEFAGFQVARCKHTSRDNVLDNPVFAEWTRGTTFTGVVQDDTPVADRFRMYTSQSGGGATFTVSRVAVPNTVGTCLPFRPTTGMRIQAPATINNQYSGVDQSMFGKTAVTQFSGRDVTLHLCGVGTLPSTDMRFSIVMWSGSATISTTTTSIPRISGTGCWYTTATVAVPPLPANQTFTGTPRVTVRMQAGPGASGAWDCTLYGFKAEFGKNPTVFSAPDPDYERLKCSRYVRALGAGRSFIGTGWRASGTRFACAVPLGLPMVGVPSVYLSGALSDLRIDSKAAGITPTSLSTSEESASGFKLVVDHPSNTGYEAGGLWSSSTDTFLLVDCEK